MKTRDLTVFLTRIFIVVSMVLVVTQVPTSAAVEHVASRRGTSEPPFLNYGVQSNLLMLLDNSGSMWDMAYVEDVGYCTADDFDPDASYAGYFEEESWYKYDSGAEQFVGTTSAAGDSAAASGTRYYNVTLDVFLTIEAGADPAPETVTYFAAKGNFLNWAATSKFDIQKDILTGGKYDDLDDALDSTGQLVLENRGCAGRRFVKEIAVTTDGTDSFSITLAIRKPDDNEKSDADDNTTRIEIFTVTEDGFDDAACQRVVDAMADGSYTLGGTKQDVKDCLGYSEISNTAGTESYAAFNHVMQFCWWHSKHGEWPNDNVNDMKNACEGIYDAGVPPGSLSPASTGYGCYGVYNVDPDLREGYVGRCWEIDPLVAGCVAIRCDDPDGDGDPDNDTDILPQSDKKDYIDPYCGGNGNVYYCDGDFTPVNGKCTATAGTTGTWLPLTDPPGCAPAPATPPDWIADPCVFEAMQDYCGVYENPEVIDPSDLVSQTSEYANIPAVMIDSGVLSQLSEPLLVMTGRIAVATPPTGLLQKQKDSIRMGAMVFNENGSASECDGNEKIDCPASSNMDGGYVMTYIATNDNADAHNNSLISKINDIKATTWTPIAEAMHNAIGYYSQDTGLRLNTTDFDTTLNPIESWCQPNYVLIITEGSSTTDLHEAMGDFLATVTDADGLDSDGDPASCGALSGSSLLDDLTLAAQNSLFGDQDELLDPPNNRNIKTFIVAAGSLRVTGTDECSPDVLLDHAATNGGTTLYRGENPEDLKDALKAVFDKMRDRASSGSAASVISSSRGGAGAIYQAIFWPELKRDDYTVEWAGDVHALFIDPNGNMFEDTSSGVTGALDSGDKQIIVYFDRKKQKSMACDVTNWDATNEETPCSDPKFMDDVEFIWSAADWLSDSGMDFLISSNRSPYLSESRQRYIYTWNDLNNDGIVDQSTEWIAFEDSTNWAALSVDTTRSSVPVDFDVVTENLTALQEDAKVDDIVNWIRGKDRLTPIDFNGDGDTADDGEGALRSRQIPESLGSANLVTARLGDVIHSTPMTVTSPAEGFHLIYGDYSYAKFSAQYKKRRHVIYFGGNDGMLHAVNAGCYVATEGKFYNGVDPTTGNCVDAPSSQPALGAELWAYVPYNLLPHLSSLTFKEDLNADPPKLGYAHKYYVDLRPRIFDVQIFSDDADHPEGWGTILVGGMRLGGAPINASELNGYDAADVRQFTSAYFIFDITNPEIEPKLLGEFTRLDGAGHVDLGHSMAIPSMVIMKKENAVTQTSDNAWYLVFGSGPHGSFQATTTDTDDAMNYAMKGVSDQNAKISILPLAWLVANPTALRIPAAAPGSGQPSGTLELTGSPNGFTSDLVTIDGDINSSNNDYMADALYFGTVEGDFAVDGNDEKYWDGGGKLYRLMTRVNDAAPDGSTGYLFGDKITQEISTPDQWSNSILMDMGQPVSGAINLSYDNYNFWIYAGTGRFFDVDDKTDATQYSFYGIKEPMGMKTDGTDNWMEFLGSSVAAPSPSVHGYLGYPSSAERTWPDLNAGVPAPGSKGLLKVDEIRVALAASPEAAQLSCRDETAGSTVMDCIPPEMRDADKTKLGDLIHYIAGPDPAAGDTENLYNSTDGWYVDFYPYANRERIVGQSTIFGGLVTFTTYQPYSDICMAEGNAYLYSLYYQTGTAWNQQIYGANGLYENSDDVREKMSLGKGLATTPNLHVSGDGQSVSAIVQTSTGVIVEQKQENLATEGYFTGRSDWRECVE
jgi:type IV pilus assembly protein PilY1